MEGGEGGGGGKWKGGERERERERESLPAICEVNVPISFKTQ